jgi:hypothetical protein
MQQFVPLPGLVLPPLHTGDYLQQLANSIRIPEKESHISDN